jgi:hypothetical protein
MPWSSDLRPHAPGAIVGQRYRLNRLLTLEDGPVTWEALVPPRENPDRRGSSASWVPSLAFLTLSVASAGCAGTSTNESLSGHDDPRFEIGSQSPALADSVSRLDRTLCVAQVVLNGSTPPAGLDLADIDRQFFTDRASVSAFYAENSYGHLNITGRVYGPFAHSMTTCDQAALDALAAAVRPNITDACDQYAYVMVPMLPGCWRSFPTIGTPSQPGRDTWYNGTLGCVETVQELGRSFGLGHSSSIVCTGGSLNDALTGCVHSEYGDRDDAMGSGCRHLNVWHKQHQGWFDTASAIKVTSSGTHFLYPIEAPVDGVRSIQVPFPGCRLRPFQDSLLSSYYLEYRTSVGFDTGMEPQVMMRVAPDPSQTSNSKTWVVPVSSLTQRGLGLNESFTDPVGGVTISATAIDADKATIQIDIAGDAERSTCVDAGNEVNPDNAAPAQGSDGCACTTRRTNTRSVDLGYFVGLALLVSMRRRLTSSIVLRAPGRRPPPHDGIGDPLVR